MKRFFVALVVLAVIGLGTWGYHLRRTPAKPDAAGNRGGPVPVTVAAAERKPVPLDLRTFGTVEPVATVALKSQITGVLTNALFVEGQEVREGDLLFVIDPRPQESLLRQAESSRTRNAALLANAEKEARRQDELFKSGVTAEDACDQARTQVDALRALLQSDDAAIEQSRLQLGYCRIVAPVNGRIGARQIDVGNLVKANDVTLATLNQLKPIHVRFTLPQQDLGRVRERMAAAPLDVLAALPDSASNVHTGRLFFIDNAIDPATGTIPMKARFDNDDERLWPGQFVTVILRLAVQTNALVVPARAVLAGQKGSYVYVAQPDNTVSSRVVQIERTCADDAVIAAGIEPGERVVTEGQLRLAPGARITVKKPASGGASAPP